MKADIFILHHDPTSFQSIGDIQILSSIKGRGGEARPQVLFRSVGGEGDAAVGQLSAHASHSMHMSRLNTVSTSQFKQRWSRHRQRPIKAEFHFGFDVLQSDCLVAHGHFVA